MKKVFLLAPLVASLVACGTTDTFDKQAERMRDRQDAGVERAVDKAPKWMTELPKSDNAVYANGSGQSADWNMAVTKAKLVAYSRICMAAGGKVDSSSKMFLQDSGDVSHATTELAVRGMCQAVDITGVKSVEVKTIPVNGRFYSYALVALPTGDVNVLKRAREVSELQARAEKRGSEVFSEMDKKKD